MSRRPFVISGVAFTGPMIEPPPATPEQLAREHVMYGASAAAVVSAFTARIAPPELYIAGILSDAQEQLARGQVERCRQMLNEAKLCLFYKRDSRLSEDGGAL